MGYFGCKNTTPGGGCYLLIMLCGRPLIHKKFVELVKGVLAATNIDKQKYCVRFRADITEATKAMEDSAIKTLER